MFVYLLSYSYRVFNKKPFYKVRVCFLLTYFTSISPSLSLQVMHKNCTVLLLMQQSEMHFKP